MQGYIEGGTLRGTLRGLLEPQEAECGVLSNFGLPWAP